MTDVGGCIGGIGTQEFLFKKRAKTRITIEKRLHPALARDYIHLTPIIQLFYTTLHRLFYHTE